MHAMPSSPPERADDVEAWPLLDDPVTLEEYRPSRASQSTIDEKDVLRVLTNDRPQSAARQKKIGISRILWVSVAIFLSIAATMATVFKHLYFSAPPRQPNDERITFFTSWTGNHEPRSGYLGTFLDSMAQQSAHFDIIILNFYDGEQKCFSSETLNLPNNVRIICMSREEQKERLITLLCHPTYGWNCNEETRARVAKHAGDLVWRDAHHKNLIFKVFCLYIHWR